MLPYGMIWWRGGEGISQEKERVVLSEEGSEAEENWSLKVAGNERNKKRLFAEKKWSGKLKEAGSERWVGPGSRSE